MACCEGRFHFAAQSDSAELDEALGVVPFHRLFQSSDSVLLILAGSCVFGCLLPASWKVYFVSVNRVEDYKAIQIRPLVYHTLRQSVSVLRAVFRRSIRFFLNGIFVFRVD